MIWIVAGILFRIYSIAIGCVIAGLIVGNFFILCYVASDWRVAHIINISSLFSSIV